eukprot:245835-Hanusia_phi.AAC.1
MCSVSKGSGLAALLQRAVAIIVFDECAMAHKGHPADRAAGVRPPDAFGSLSIKVLCAGSSKGVSPRGHLNRRWSS